MMISLSKRTASVVLYLCAGACIVNGSFFSQNRGTARREIASGLLHLNPTVAGKKLFAPGLAHPNRDEISTEINEAPDGLLSRRAALFGATSFLISVAVPDIASAKEDPLFKPNPLVNPVLEKIRIWEQAEADNINYGGELAPGSPLGREAYGKLLVPILQIQKDLDAVEDLVHMVNGEGLGQAREVLERPQLQNKSLKKTFNAHSDNIYYSDPDRANLYLAGGAVPRSAQSLAYLHRNDVLTNVDALQAEVVYLIKEKNNGAGFVETEDLYKYINDARESMAKYLDLVPPAELKLGKEQLSAQS
mmetsp:Transcript_37263/g.111579  ORF Transcript_37263/g.111579 Transcript_37263/m.111579 type:complete len:305 (-) Transcript_37263:656-1570(-)